MPGKAQNRCSFRKPLPLASAAREPLWAGLAPCPGGCSGDLTPAPVLAPA